MDIDPPNLCSNLKRSNSAPMINELGINATCSSQDNIRGRNNGTPVAQRTQKLTQTRRFSGSFSPSRSSHSPTAPLSPLVLTRVSQIKQEESMDVVFREAAHERETKSKLQISHSLEDLTLDEASFGENSKRSITDPLRIHTSHIVMCSSPSPTNTGRQCFSPSTCMPVHQSAFSSTPSPSPTRKNFTRCSQSPISLRPSQLSLKRKFDMDSDDSDYTPSSAKHLNTGMSSPESDARSNPHHHIQNLSFNSMDTCNSDQSETRRSTDSLSSCMSSPYGTFKPVDPAPSNPKSYN